MSLLFLRPAVYAEMADVSSSSSRDISEHQDEAIQALTKRLHSIEAEMKVTQASLRERVSEEEKRELFDQLKSLEASLNETKFKIFETVAPKLDLTPLKSIHETSFTLRGAIEDVIRPLIEDFKRATADSREAQVVRNQYRTTKLQSEVLNAGLKKLKQNIEQTTDPELRKSLQQVQKYFTGRLDSINDELDILTFHIDHINREQKSFVGETKSFIETFFRQRGKNLTVTTLAILITFFALNLFHRYLHNYTQLFSRKRSFWNRLFDISLALFSFVGAVLVGVVVLMSFGDWVLVSLFILILFGAIILLKDSIPNYLDEIRLLLNIGAVREGERINIDGVSWNVEKLSFFTILKNPALRNGSIRLPVASLTNYLSHPESSNEPFFPTDEGDWVELDDQTYGRVIFQNVETVRLVLLGGAQKNYTIRNFLSQNPKNFSHNFRISTMIGIDYANQSTSTKETLEKLREFFNREIHKEISHEDILSLKIEFALANASSLDYQVNLDLKGHLAPRRMFIKRMLQRIGVDACNEFSLGIPFQQITLHKAGE
ncbi:MAG: hypothetical protein ACK5LK_06860 [Chthoniobacterales bacterium]